MTFLNGIDDEDLDVGDLPGPMARVTLGLSVGVRNRFQKVLQTGSGASNLQKTSRIQESLSVELAPMRKLIDEHVKMLPSSSFDGMNIKRDELVFPSSDIDSLFAKIFVYRVC